MTTPRTKEEFLRLIVGPIHSPPEHVWKELKNFSITCSIDAKGICVTVRDSSKDKIVTGKAYVPELLFAEYIRFFEMSTLMTTALGTREETNAS